MIRFDNIRLGYGSRTLIENLSAELHRGQLTALVGRNGTGKSTLLRAIAQLGETLGGDILLDGRSLQTLSPSDMASLVAFVTTDKGADMVNMFKKDVLGLISKVLVESQNGVYGMRAAMREAGASAEEISKIRRISSRQIQLSQSAHKYTGNRKTKGSQIFLRYNLIYVWNNWIHRSKGCN